MLTLDQIKQAVTKIGKKYEIGSAYLFGSYAKGTANEYSDVDVLIDSGKIKSLIQLSGFRLDLIDELGGTEVDVVTTDGAKPRFLEMVKKDRILLYGC